MCIRSVLVCLVTKYSICFQPTTCFAQYIKKNNKGWGVAAIFATQFIEDIAAMRKGIFSKIQVRGRVCR